MNHEIPQFNSGTHNRDSDENIPADASQDSKNYVTKDNRLVLAYGKVAVGNVGIGKIYGHHFGYTVNGTPVHYRKMGTKIQYLSGSTWTDVITGLTETEEYTFANYSSLAGAFTFINGKDGYWKINNANPTSAMQMYNSAKNFHGKIIIDRGRTLLWDRNDTSSKDKTGLYGSKIDRQNSTVYNNKTAEVLGASGSTNYTGTLAAKKTSTITVTIASPGVFTLASHGFLLNDRVVFSTTGALPTGLTAGTTYYVISAGLTTNEFQVSATEGGAAINTSGSQSGTHTLSSSTRNVFGLLITGTTGAGVETFRDNFDGTLTSDMGGSGTINYATGAFNITFNASVSSGNVLCNYQWEDSNIGGLTDFTKSATRVGGEGFQFPQDEGGDAILAVVVGQDGAYYSLKSYSAYQLILSDDDVDASNIVFRKDLGIPFFRAVVSTSKGIVFMNTANPNNPELTILRKNQFGDALEVVALFEHFDFSQYEYDDCCIGVTDRYFTIACKTIGADNNDTVLLCNIANPVLQKNGSVGYTQTVDITAYAARTFAKAKDDGSLYAGSPFSADIYKLYDGFDDDGSAVDNFWISKGETYGGGMLKKYRRKRFKGLIGADQIVEVYESYDDAGFELIGTIRGDGSYVDYAGGQSVGMNMVGESLVGGDPTAIAYPYFMELKVSTTKFRKRTYKLVATEIGYFDVEMMMDYDLLLFEQRIPKRFRQKQNVSLDGQSTNQ